MALIDVQANRSIFILLAAAGIAYVANIGVTSLTLLMPTDPYDPYSPNNRETTASSFTVRSLIILTVLVLGIILIISG